MQTQEKKPEQSNVLECPQCGKKVLVQRDANRYHCLWCNFSCDLSDADSKDNPSSVLLSFLITGIMLLLIL